MPPGLRSSVRAAPLPDRCSRKAYRLIFCCNAAWNWGTNMKQALVLGAGGFIGGHLVRRLKSEGFWVRGVDLKFNEYRETEADDFVIGDLRDQFTVRNVVDRR